MLKEWKKAKKVFKKPKLKVYFGFWTIPNFIVRLGAYLMRDGFEKHKFLTWIWNLFCVSDLSLPVWRRGNRIHLFKKQRVYNKDRYEWNQEFQNKLNKWHLGWLKPEYELPIWLSCYVFKHDMMWKWKYDDVRYEFPPQFTIVLFNISLTLHWHAPVDEQYLYDDNYWECILNYNYKPEHCGNVFDLSDYVGISTIYAGEDKPIYKSVLSPKFLKDDNLAYRLYRKQLEDIELIKKKEAFLSCDCGGRMVLNETAVLPTNPVKYEYKCYKCGKTKYSYIRY